MSLNFEEYQKIVEECLELSKRKNADYGSSTMTKFGAKGFVVRMNDKMERMINLIWNDKNTQVTDEKIEDTAKDMINYSLYLVMLLRGKLEK